MHAEDSTAPIANDTTMLPGDNAAYFPEENYAPVFGVRIANLGFLVSSKRHCEVLDRVQVNPLPNMHPWISGMVNLRGNLVPVFDLGLLLDESGNSKKRRLFSIERGERAAALWIDNYPEIKNMLSLKPLNTLPALPEILQRHTVGGYESDGQVWLDVNYEDLFKALGRHQYATGEMAS